MARLVGAGHCLLIFWGRLEASNSRGNDHPVILKPGALCRAKGSAFSETRRQSFVSINRIGTSVVLVAHTIREEAEDEIVRLISAQRATRQRRVL